MLWTASAFMAVSAAAMAIVLRPAVSMASAPSPSVSLPSVSSVVRAEPRPDDGAPGPRVSDFLSRIAAFRRVEGTLSKAFGPVETPRAVAAPRARPTRVAQGATPQACLAQAVYYEARGEPADGQAAVAQVVLNRARSGRHPADVCGVVFEGAARSGCQFSFACDPRLAARRPEAAAWRRAQAVASEALEGGGAAPPELAGVLNYHADYVRPRWAARLDRAAVIGRHIFYAAVGAASRAASGWSFAPPSAAPAAASGA